MKNKFLILIFGAILLFSTLFLVNNLQQEQSNDVHDPFTYPLEFSVDIENTFGTRYDFEISIPFHPNYNCSETYYYILKGNSESLVASSTQRINYVQAYYKKSVNSQLLNTDFTSNNFQYFYYKHGENLMRINWGDNHCRLQNLVNELLNQYAKVDSNSLENYQISMVDYDYLHIYNNNEWCYPEQSVNLNVLQSVHSFLGAKYSQITYIFDVN